MAAASGTSALERLVRRDRAVIAIALAAVAIIAWAYLLRMARTMGGAGMGTHLVAMAMPHTQPWSALQPVALFAMWVMMMIAMMLPSAGPVILLVASVARRRRAMAHPAAPTALFAAGYLVVWVAFSAVAALVQLGLHRAALLSPAMAVASPVLGGVLLVAAGAYQWLPTKSLCLHHCRSPLGVLGSEWREGRLGALTMGLRHGLFCVGCCWALMALLFAAGVMNVLWVAALAGVVLVEKVAPRGPLLGRAAGVVFAAWGVRLIVWAA